MTEYSIFPPDLTGYKAVGVKLPFNRNTFTRTALESYNALPARDVGPFQLSYTTEDQSISNVINLLFTRRGERVMHPNFGTVLRDTVFEQYDETTVIILEDDIRDQVQFWLPYIVIKRLEFKQAGRTELPSNEDLHSLLINFTFSVTENGANRTIKIYLGEGGDLQTDII
jgi:hypothetical protein